MLLGFAAHGVALHRKWQGLTVGTKVGTVSAPIAVKNECHPRGIQLGKLPSTLAAIGHICEITENTDFRDRPTNAAKAEKHANTQKPAHFVDVFVGVRYSGSFDIRTPTGLVRMAHAACPKTRASDSLQGVESARQDRNTSCAQKQLYEGHQSLYESESLQEELRGCALSNVVDYPNQLDYLF
jgi:hypothetical protein